LALRCDTQPRRPKHHDRRAGTLHAYASIWLLIQLAFYHCTP
jgi:hypothetical protein